MKICRFDDNRLGLVEGDVLRDVTAALDVLPGYGYPLPQLDPLIANLDAALARIKTLAADAPVLPLTGRKWLAPVANPGTIVVAPVNCKKYLQEARDDAQIHHNNQIAEIQKIGLSLKATSSLVGASHGVALQHADRRNDHEAELVVIGKAGPNITGANTHDLILSIGELIEFASSFDSLLPGDLIYTGTPEGVGPVLPDDTIVTDFEGIGRMHVAVTLA